MNDEDNEINVKKKKKSNYVQQYHIQVNIKSMVEIVNIYFKIVLGIPIHERYNIC